MFNLRRSKLVDLIDLFHDTSRYLYDLLTFNNPDFEKHTPSIYPKVQLNIANTSDIQAPFLGLNIYPYQILRQTQLFQIQSYVLFPMSKW